jgi:hypothetical protein
MRATVEESAATAGIKPPRPAHCSTLRLKVRPESASWLNATRQK